MNRRHLTRLAAAVVMLLAAGPLLGIINPNFTPVDLIQESAQVLLARVSLADDDAVRLSVVETVRGDSRDDESLELDLAGSGSIGRKHVETALAGRDEGTGVLVLYETGADVDADTPVGSLQIETIWFAVHRRDGKLVLEEDRRKLFAIWGGDATRLAAATRHIQADRLATFPTASDLIWEDEHHLGTLAGPAAACLQADLGEGARDLLVASPAGDRAYRWAADGEPTDITDELGLTTRSHRIVLADVDDDGQIDLISWDGNILAWSGRNPDGRFVAPTPLVDLAACLSLAVVADPAGRAAFVVGTAAGPHIVRRNAAGEWATIPLPGDGADVDALGAGGCCAVADLDADGRCDVIACYAEAIVVHRGVGGEAGFAPGRRHAIRTIRAPRVSVCADFDGDGRLDLAIGGGGGVALLGWHDGGELADFTGATAELTYHGNQHDPEVIALAVTDINADGKPAVALFYRERKPMLFFNRGFGCMGWARKLEPSYVEDEDPLDLGGFDDPPTTDKDPADHLPGLVSLQGGQFAGSVGDIDGDGAQDLIAVGTDHAVRLIRGVLDRAGRAWSLTLVLPPEAVGPRTVTLWRDERKLGIRPLRPGRPIAFPCTRAGPVRISWKTPDGEDRETKTIVAKPQVRLVLPPLRDEGLRIDIADRIRQPTPCASPIADDGAPDVIANGHVREA